MSDDVTLLHEKALTQHRAEVRRLQARVDELSSLLAAESAKVAEREVRLTAVARLVVSAEQRQGTAPRPPRVSTFDLRNAIEGRR